MTNPPSTPSSNKAIEDILDSLFAVYDEAGEFGKPPTKFGFHIVGKEEAAQSIKQLLTSERQNLIRAIEKARQGLESRGSWSTKDYAKGRQDTLDEFEARLRKELSE